MKVDWTVVIIIIIACLAGMATLQLCIGLEHARLELLERRVVVTYGNMTWVYYSKDMPNASEIPIPF